MIGTTIPRVAAALAFLLFVLAACGGGGTASSPSFTVIAVMPDTSNDVNGGDRVTITGTNFLTVTVFRVTFGNSPGTNLNVMSNTMLEVTTPPSPGGIAQSVTIEVFSLDAGSKFLAAPYTYLDPGGTPSPQTITPTTFTPTGAQTFTIGGSNLGPAGGNVSVIFVGVGTVQGTVSANSQLVTGRAPVSAGIPPATPITVTVDTGTDQANVPTLVTYSFASPIDLPAAGQEPNGASRPVRVSDGMAVMCTAGANLTWGDADDDVVLVDGPGTPTVRTVLTTGGASIGFLDGNNSIPAVLDENTICIYSVGLNGIPDGPATAQDDTIILITNVQTPASLTVTPLGFGQLNTAPLAAIAANRVAFVTAGADLTRGTNDDQLFVVEFLGTAFTALATPVVGQVDTTAGRTNFSIPFSPDGNAVFVMTVGGDGVASSLDDRIHRVIASTGGASSASAPNLAAPPWALTASLLVAPGAGNNNTLGDGDDELVVITAAGGLTLQSQALGAAFDLAAVVPVAPLGTTGAAVPVVAANPVVVFTDPAAGTRTSLTMAGTPLLAPLGSGGLVIFGQGPGGVPFNGNEQCFFVPTDASTALNFAVPGQNQAIAVLTDSDRAFGPSPGADGVFDNTSGNNDDRLVVQQALALGNLTNTAVLPITIAPLLQITGNEPFVPIGSNWGIIQTPGPSRVYRDASDRIIVVRY